ncbi:hypothetical protein AAE028_00475 [Sinorhizobium sp. CB9]
MGVFDFPISTPSPVLRMRVFQSFFYRSHHVWCSVGSSTGDSAGHPPGDGPDSFDTDPPNATISVLNAGFEPSDAVVTLRSPKLDGTTLTFDVSVLEGNLTGTGPAALFIDQRGRLTGTKLGASG